MTSFGEIIGYWLGLCRKPPTVYTMQADFGFAPQAVCEGEPGAGGGGAETIRPGIDAALSGMRTLNRNRQLLWFTILAGIVLVGNTIGQAAFWYLSYNLHMELSWIAWQFFIELATMFCLVFLLAGLVLSLSSKEGRAVSFFKGLAGTKRFVKALSSWSFVLALACMLLVIVLTYIPSRFPTPELLFLYHHGLGQIDSFLFTTLSQYPFNLSRLPPMDIFTEIPGYGGRSVLLWIYPGLRVTLMFSVINLFLLVLTPFVIPLIVLGKATIRDAVAGSFVLLKKTAGVVVTCGIFLGVIVSGMFLAYLLIQAAHGMVTPLATYYRPTDPWIALGLLYDIALASVAMVVATVGGIAAWDLYNNVTCRQLAGTTESAGERP